MLALATPCQQLVQLVRTPTRRILAVLPFQLALHVQLVTTAPLKLHLQLPVAKAVTRLLAPLRAQVVQLATIAPATQLLKQLN